MSEIIVHPDVIDCSPQFLTSLHALNSQIPAQALETSAILEHLQTTATGGDVILIMSNGKFDNLHERLLKVLESEKRQV